MPLAEDERPRNGLNALDSRIVRRAVAAALKLPYKPPDCHREPFMDIDLPEVVAEVRAAFDRYEKALGENDVAVLDETFRVDPRTIRYGMAEILYGHDEIAAFRAARSPVGLTRTISRTVITTYGREFAVASTLFHRESMPGKVGRQMQTWVKFPDGWRVVAAHVSAVDEASVWKVPGR